MNSKDIKVLLEVIPILNKNEVSILKRFVKSNYRENLSHRFLLLINKLSSPSKLPSRKDLSKSFTRSDFRRLRELTEQSIINHVQENREEALYPVFQQKFNVRLLLIIIEVIKTRPAIETTNIILDRCEKICRKFQLYDQLIEVLYIKSEIVYSGSNSYKMETIKNDIERFENCRNKVNKSKIIYRDYFSQIVTKGFNRVNTRILKEAIIELISNFKETGSHVILLNIYLLQMELALLEREFNRGKEVGLNAIKFLKSSEIVKTKTRIGYFYFNIADNQLCSLDFIDSIFYAEKSKGYFREESLNRLVASNYKIAACLYQMENESCQEELDSVFNLQILSSYPFYQSKFQYYQAILFFIQGQFDLCWKILSQHLELEKDKEGWRVWLSIMRIICQIERNEQIEVDLQIQSFRKYIQRWEQRAEIRERDKLVFRVLESLNRNYLNFEKVAVEEKELLTVLAYPKGDLRWEPNSPELVLFHDWFQSKLQKRAYHPNFEPFKAQKTRQISNNYLVDIQVDKD